MTASCGGHTVGEIVGSKTLTEYTGRNKFGHHQWMWRCGVCQRVYGPTRLSHLKRYDRCQPCATLRENNGRWKGHEEISGVWLSQYQSDAAKRGLVWSVTPEQLWDLWLEQRTRCAYTGWQLTHGVDASLDRIDNDFGYILGNVQWVHRNINRMKSDFSDDDFRRMCAAVAGVDRGQ